MALIKPIQYFGQQTNAVCDGLCNKAWGTQCRPAVFFDPMGQEIAHTEWVTKDGPEPDPNAVGPMGIKGYAHHVWFNGHIVTHGDPDKYDYDDHAYLADNELGIAPEDPGTYEGADSKPDMEEVNADPSLMNKWCVRQCERCDLLTGLELSERMGKPITSDFSERRFNIPETKEKVRQLKAALMEGLDRFVKK